VVGGVRLDRLVWVPYNFVSQEAGIATLAGIGLRVLTSRGDDLTDSDDEILERRTTLGAAGWGQPLVGKGN
jgi:hypothetical protein